MIEKRTLEILEYAQIRNRIQEKCSFTGGKRIIEDMQPLDSFLAIQKLLKDTKYALECTYAYGAMPFHGIREIRPAVHLAMKGGVISIQDLQNISQHNSGVRSIQAYINHIEKDTGPIGDYVSSLMTVDQVANEIERCIRSDGNIEDNASPDLARIRKQLKKHRTSLEQQTKSFLKENASKLTEQITTTRNDRFVVLAKSSYRNQFNGIQYDESASGNTVYLEPSELIPLNNALQEAKQKEAREIEKILRELSRQVSEVGDQLIANMETISLLDSIFAKAEYGKEIDGVTPELKEENELVIVSGWHPLLEKEKAVRNTYRLCDPNRTLLITGPNTGGKTVSLKTIGLFALMTYSGIPVSAEKACFPLYDNIFVDIGDNQSIEQSLSTFSAHMQVLAEIFEKASTQSLVILDELISGTDPKEGEALAVATLDYFRKKGVFFLSSTHYDGLKLYAQEHDDVLIASMTFDLEKLEPTYHYKEGSVGQSNAFDIALRYGFPKNLVDEAKEMRNQTKTDNEKLMEKLTQKEFELEKKEEELSAVLKENQETQEYLEKERDQWNRERIERKESMEEELKEQLQVKLEEANAIIEELKSQSEYSLPKSIQAKSDLAHLMDDQEDLIEDDPTTFNVGDIVRILRNNQIGTIEEIHNGRVTLNVRGILVKTNLDGLKKEKALPKVEPKKQKRPDYKPSHFSTELNLIGQTVSEAIPMLDQFLDQAILHRVGMVRVIHGFGTGKLKNAVWDHLKKNKNVTSFELAKGSEGGGGATMVYFKQ